MLRLAVRRAGGDAGQRLGPEVAELFVGEGYAHHCWRRPFSETVVSPIPGCVGLQESEV